MRYKGLDVDLHGGRQGFSGPVTLSDPVGELGVPNQVVATEDLAMVLCNVNDDLAASEVEDALLRLRSEEFHVVCWCDLTEDTGVIEDLLVKDIRVLAGAWLVSGRPEVHLTIGLGNLIEVRGRKRLEVTLA